MPKSKLNPDNRRALALRALRGESVTRLHEEYGVARAWIYFLMQDALSEEALEEARKEYEFRQEALRELT